MKVLLNKHYTGIIRWMPSGNSFIIVDSKRFVAEILPEHFKTAKFSSFTRKLHRWGFVRHYKGDEAGAFYHESFRRGKLDLIDRMTCHKDEPAKPVTVLSPPALPASGKSAEPAPATIPVPVARVSLPTPAQIIPRATRDPCVNFDAAIELEVARRVQERFDAAVLGRAQALLLIQKEQQRIKRQGLQLLQQEQERQLIQQQQERQLLQEEALRNSAILGNPINQGWSQDSISMLKRSILPLQGLSLEYKLRLLSGGGAPDVQPFKSMPKTNIFGAKTA